MFGAAPLRHRLAFGRGMVSDDTEHACMTAQALLASRGDPERFARSLAWRLRGWFVALPAGVGMATAKACIKLWLGFPPGRSGVNSVGNGPAMRAAVIGVYAADDLPRLKRLIAASTRLTHVHPDAEHGALAIALAAAYALQRDGRGIQPVAFLDFVRLHLAGTPILERIERAAHEAMSGASMAQWMDGQGLGDGVSGYINHTVPAAIFCWLRWPTDFRGAVEQVILAGGDTDSTGAIVGALIGTTVGSSGIPADWVDGILEYPRSVNWLRQLATHLVNDPSTAATNRPLPLAWPVIPIRNLAFLTIVLLHGLRRLLPPY